MEPDTVIVRYGEIALKSDVTRKRFEQRLIENIKAALKTQQMPYEIRRERGRIFIDVDGPEIVAEVVRRVFGIVSVSPAVSVSAELKVISEETAKYAGEVLANSDTFAIRARRTGKHTFTSQDVAREAGAAVQKVKDVSVDLDNPDKEIHVEVRQEKAYIFHELIDGPGGFPLGTQGKMVALVSGGIDSPVAAWLMMKRGCEIIPLYFDNQPLTDETVRKRAVDVAKKLDTWSYGVEFRLLIAPYGEAQRTMIEKAPQKLTCVLCKRGMYRVAEKIARQKGAKGIVTGESLGQVASQTLSNLQVLDEAVALPVFRPLIGLDKVEIEDIAREIGTYDLSARSVMGCQAVPKRPETKAKPTEVQAAEEKINMARIVKDVVEKTEIVKL